MKTFIIRVTALVVFICISPQSYAATFNVSTTPELRTALTTAATNGEDDTIILADGIYKTTEDGEGTFIYLSNEANSLTIRGSNRENVFVSGDEQHQILNHNSTVNAPMILENISFINGLKLDGDGGGVYTDYQLAVINCDFIGNSAKRRGGGFYAKQILVMNSLFKDNSAGAGGGGFFSDPNDPTVSCCTYKTNNVENSQFQNNSSLTGAGFYSNHNLNVRGSLFSGNVASSVNGYSGGSGGGGFFALAPILRVENSKFINNRVEENSSTVQSGGGFTSSTPGQRGASYYAYIMNNVFDGNYSRDGGGSYKSDGYSGATKYVYALNNLHVNNSSAAYFDGENNVIANSVFLDNLTEDVGGESGAIVILKNNYIDISKVNTLNIKFDNIYEDINLGFVDADNNNYQLAESSDLIDSGTTDIDNFGFPATDIDGNPRISGGLIDIGPYEFDRSSSTDIDNDGAIDLSDNCPAIPNADQLNTDGDQWGDACDDDDDNDGYADDNDTFPLDSSEWLDTDGDQIGNNTDDDDDNDGVSDYADPAPLAVTVVLLDSDGDGYPDNIDDFPLDSTKQYSGSGDLDGDGYTNDEEVDYCSSPLDATSQPNIGGLPPTLIKAAIDATQPTQ